MNLTSLSMNSEWMRALGWTFVHSLWQIALIGFLLFIILRQIPNRSAHIRYTLSTLALWSVVVMALSTFIIMLPESKLVTELSGNIVLVHSQDSTPVIDRISTWLESRMPLMLMIWLGGVTILMVRLALSIGWVRYMKVTALPNQEIQLTLTQILTRLRLKISPAVSVSRLVSSPVTIGHLKPFILFPVGIINHLSPSEVEAVLTHELAHIIRRDYLSNLIQSFIETLFYYHPVTWWISGMVRTERENRADDLAVSWCGDHLAYAKALMTVQELQVRQRPSLAIGFASRKGAMLARIQRILNIPYKNHNQMEKTVLLSLCSLCLLAFTLTNHIPADHETKKANPTQPFISCEKQITDSIPSTGTYLIHKKTDTQDISIQVEDGDIKELKIDGKQIQPSEFESYDELIDGLFGAIEAPPSMEGFGSMMPHIPSMPPMPAMPSIPPMPSMPPMPAFPVMPPFPEGFNFEMPAMPPMPNMDFEQFFDGKNFKWSGDGSTITIYSPEYKNGVLKTPGDSIVMNGSPRIIIYHGNDSTVLSPPSGWTVEAPIFFNDGDSSLNTKEWKEQQEAWREQQLEWRKNQEQWRDQWRKQGDERRAQQEQMRDGYRNQYLGNLDELRSMENEKQRAEELARVYEFNSPRLSLSDEMVGDGLVEPGEEITVQLTPEKLKINGQKMSEDLHRKYLRMYEAQQGIKLSGNSRVEFTTKSKQRM